MHVCVVAQQTVWSTSGKGSLRLYANASVSIL